MHDGIFSRSLTPPVGPAPSPSYSGCSHNGDGCPLYTTFAECPTSVLNKTRPFLCSLSRMRHPRVRQPRCVHPPGFTLILSLFISLARSFFFPYLSLSLSVCGFYNQIRVDLSRTRARARAILRARRPGLLSEIYVLASNARGR